MSAAQRNAFAAQFGIERMSAGGSAIVVERAGIGCDPSLSRGDLRGILKHIVDGDDASAGAGQGGGAEDGLDLARVGDLSMCEH